MRIKTSWVALSVVVLAAGLLLVASLWDSLFSGGQQSAVPERSPPPGASVSAEPTAHSNSTTGADGCCAISEARTDAVRATRGATNCGSAIDLPTRLRRVRSTTSPDCSRAATSTDGGGSAIGTRECATDNSLGRAVSRALSASANRTAGGDGHSATSYAATERATGGSRDVGGRSPAGSRSAASLGLLQRACRRHLRATDPRSHPPLPTGRPVRRDWLPHGGPGQPLGYASMKRLRFAEAP